MERLKLDFSFLDEIDLTCEGIDKLVADQANFEESGSLIENIVIDDQISALMKDMSDLRPPIGPQFIPDLFESLADTAKRYAEDGFEAFQDVSECFFMNFNDAIECFGLDSRYIQKLIDIADAKSPAPASAVTSHIAMGFAALAGVAVLWFQF